MFYITRKHDDINESSVCNIDIGGVHSASPKETNQNRIAYQEKYYF